MSDSKQSRREHEIAREMDRCVHFNGIMNDRCLKDVAYDSVRGGRGLACLQPKNECCAVRQNPTRAEAEKIVDERNAHVAEVLAGMRIGRCPTCWSMGDDWLQAGRCIYQKPCGHRVGQGDAKAYKSGVLHERKRQAQP